MLCDEKAAFDRLLGSALLLCLFISGDLACHGTV